MEKSIWLPEMRKDVSISLRIVFENIFTELTATKRTQQSQPWSHC